jgi:hypothetical protein
MLQGIVFENLRKTGSGCLTHLNIELSCRSAARMNVVAKLSNLQHLTIRQHSSVWEDDPLRLRPLCGLKQLCSLEVENVDHVARPPTGLALHHVTNIGVRCSCLRDWDLLYLVGWTPQLKVLTIECCPLLTAEGLTQAVTASPKLRALNIIHVGPR